MSWQDTGSAVVIVANQFNPSIVRESWMLKHGILQDRETHPPGSVYTDLFVQAISDKFNIVLIPNQMQFFPVVPDNEKQRLIVDKVGTIVKTLPETPYQAIGLNFNWHYTPIEGDNIARLTREMFYIATDPLYQRFSADGSYFGAYLSKDFLGFRLNLHIMPVLINPPISKTPENRLQVSFNFHYDLGDESRTEQIIEKLGHWDEARSEADGILHSIQERHNL